MFGLTTTRRLHAELAAAKAETDRQRKRAEWWLGAQLADHLAVEGVAL